MNTQYHRRVLSGGMTLVEVLVTITVLSFVMGSSLGIYSKVLKTIRIRDSILTMIGDADVIMMYLGQDLRHADEILSNYATNSSQTVVVALKSINMASPHREERVIAYMLDADRPNRLVRSVYAEQNSISIELSPRIGNIKVNPSSPGLVEVKLMLTDMAAGKAQIWQASTTFAVKE